MTHGLSVQAALTAYDKSMRSLKDRMDLFFLLRFLLLKSLDKLSFVMYHW